MKEYTFTLTEAEINGILQILVSRPYAEVSTIITKIMKQAEEQTQKK
jgi:hypothetical protein